jgi:hypothetical protein
MAWAVLLSGRGEDAARDRERMELVLVLQLILLVAVVAVAAMVFDARPNRVRVRNRT